ncbi:GGDEF domain-containing protein [Pleionea litopenaei]|uniref:diguanylate cyclase n=1 Tax=Pleionea litopenaei TaxID=3070815 RepID=A0AA51X6K4_9GAMM|nr:GGDEF domain-containing protein [Pleionea sp. HL-JVS1]WMS86921.1 GGDEF domain-containing protein [Pleionea sp. HL-JVS1]
MSDLMNHPWALIPKMRLFKLLSILLVVLSSLKTVAAPIPLEGDAILIEKLPSETAQYWKLCKTAFRPTVFYQNNCEPLNAEQADNTQQQTTISLQLKFIIDNAISEQYPGLIIEEIDGADELYLNGKRIAKTGNFPPQYENASYYSRFYFLPPDQLSYNSPNILRLNIYNPTGHHYLKYLSSNFYSSKDIMEKSLSKDIFFSSFAAILMIVFVFMAYYYLRIPGSYDALGLACFSFMASMYLVLNHHVMLNMEINTNSLLRWKTVSFIFSQLALNFFLFKALEVKARQLNRALMFFFLIFGISALIWPVVADLQTFYYWSKVTAFFTPLALLALAYLSKRDSMTPTQLFLSVALSGYFILLLFDFSRYFWLGLIDYRENTALILALTLLAVISAITMTERYWEYFKGATYDHLTGTLLRPSFIRRLSEEMQRCRRSEFCLLVAVIDIDQFKQINQNYGLETGDKALIITSATLTRALRQFDLICRLNDDEFCVAATLPNTENTEIFLQRLHEEINSASLTLENGEKLNLKATTGAVIYDMKRHEAPEMLLLDAEHSVTEAKMKQRGSIHWFDTENPPLQFIF